MERLILRKSSVSGTKSINETRELVSDIFAGPLEKVMISPRRSFDVPTNTYSGP